MATVTRLGEEYPVVIFSKSSCCMSHSIKTLIYSFGANPIVYELDEHSNGQQLEKEFKALVFIGKELIGGPNEIMSLHVKGKLVPMLLKAKAIWIAIGSNRINIHNSALNSCIILYYLEHILVRCMGLPPSEYLYRPFSY